jgi:multidrug efflux pump subunit AcrA (membrane-fusion protein)
MGDVVKRVWAVKLALLGAGLLPACSGTKAESAGGTADSSGAADSAGTPVQMARVERMTLRTIVTGPGRTAALQEERVRAPFVGTLTSLTVTVGDRVRAGQEIGSIVAQNSEAALRGAQAMLQSAHTLAERADAERAVALAEQDLVQTPLRVSRPGVVTARSAAVGERLSEGDSIVSVAGSGSIVFIAEISQSEAGRVAAGQPVEVDLAAAPRPLGGTVHGTLPADTAGSVALRVRVDLPTASPLSVGLFGTARVVVDERRNVPAVPRAAILRDDITGITQVAVVTPGGRAHWLEVATGVSDSGWVEIVRPPLDPGTRVITSGQVGLPTGARVVAAGAVSGDSGAAQGLGSSNQPSSEAPGQDSTPGYGKPGRTAPPTR